MVKIYQVRYTVENQPSKFTFVDTQATKKIFALKKRIRGVSGGTSASKTVSILVWCIDYCQSKKNENKLCTVVSESFPHLKKGAMLDFENIMKDRGYWKDKCWNDTEHTYTFETGNKLEFTSMDKYGKAHGPRRHILFLNEANNLDWKTVDQLIVRTKEIVWADWNPSEEFWFYTEILAKRDDVDFITLTYLDNDGIDEVTLKEILSHKDNKNWWTVYGLGQLGEVEGRIYTGWAVIDEIPHEARLERYGLDFGYTNDPSVIIAIYIYNGAFIIDEVAYQKGLSNKSIHDIFDNRPKALVIADSAEPKSIDEIRDYGTNILGATKGQGSVYQGIQYVQDQKISITKRSTRTLKAYRNYMFRKDKDDNVTNDPDDTIHEWSNSMDALRYGLTDLKPSEDDSLPPDDTSYFN